MSSWDLAIVGAGPAGAAAAIGALNADPTLRVVLLDRSTFPRDKSCGDGIAPQVLDLLDEAGVPSPVGDATGSAPASAPAGRARGGPRARAQHVGHPAAPSSTSAWSRRPRLPAPSCATSASGGATRCARARGDAVRLDDRHEARVVIGADGAHSVVRRASGSPPGRWRWRFVAMRRRRGPAQAPRSSRSTPVGSRRTPGRSTAATASATWGTACWPASGVPLTKAHLLARLDALLPGATTGGRDWKGHQLPLSTGSWTPPRRPGAARRRCRRAGEPDDGRGHLLRRRHRSRGRPGRRAGARLPATRARPAAAMLRRSARCSTRHLRHVRLAGRLCRHGAVVDAGLRAARRRPGVFDDLVELGLAGAGSRRPSLRGLARHLVSTAAHRHLTGTSTPEPRGDTHHASPERPRRPARAPLPAGGADPGVHPRAAARRRGRGRGGPDPRQRRRRVAPPGPAHATATAS